MASENVEVTRSAYDAFNRGDLEGWLQHLDPEIEWRMSDAFTREARVFHGHAGVREVYAIFNEAIDGIRAEPTELLEAGDAIVAPVTITGFVHGSTEPVTYQLVQVWTLRDRRAILLDVYAALEDAWAALGITPPRNSSDSISDAGTGRENR